MVVLVGKVTIELNVGRNIWKPVGKAIPSPENLISAIADEASKRVMASASPIIPNFLSIFSSYVFLIFLQGIYFPA